MFTLTEDSPRAF